MNETARAKRVRLEQADRAVDFINGVDEVTHWMAEAEEVLKSDDLGKDVESVKALLKKHSALEAELGTQDAKLTALKDSTSGFEAEAHFAKQMLVERIDTALGQVGSLIFLCNHVYPPTAKDEFSCFWLNLKLLPIKLTDLNLSD